MTYADYDPTAMNAIADIVARHVVGSRLSIRYGIAAEVLEALPSLGWVDTGIELDEGEWVQIYGHTGSYGDTSQTFDVMRMPVERERAREEAAL